MNNYEHKYTKYKNKYQQLKNRIENVSNKFGGSSLVENPIQINKLIIYSNQSLIITKINASSEKLLDGFVEDSILFLKSDGSHRDSSSRSIGETTLNINKNTFANKLSTHDEIIVTDTKGHEIKGKIDSIGVDHESKQNIISLIDKNNKLVMVNKWNQATMESAEHKQSNVTFLSSGNDLVSGTLQYLINSISWNPIYNLYLDNEKFGKNSHGVLHCNVLISNATNEIIKVDDVILVSGNLKTENLGRTSRHFSTTARMETNADMSSMETTQFSELLTIPVNHSLQISGEKYSFPLFQYDIELQNIYIIDLEGNETNQYFESKYGYIIPVIEQDLPAGLLRIYAESPTLKTTLSMGSVKINRTPKGTSLEIILGNTPRIRANLNKNESNSNVESGSINKTKYRITTITIAGTLTNDTETEQFVIVRQYIGNATLLSSDPKPERKNGYLEWHYQLKIGSTPIDLTYGIRF